MNSLELIFEWSLAATVRASVLATIILCIQLLLRGRLPAPWRYALWLPMLVVLILPVLPTVPFGWPASEEKSVIVASGSAISGVEMPAAANMATSPTRESSTSPVNPFAIAWLIGAGAVFGAGMIGYRRNLRRIERAAMAPAAALLASIQIAAKEVGLRKLPRVLVSSAVESPAVTGIFRSSLLLPAEFPEGFDEDETQLILLHELTHLKRHDLAVNGLACVLQALHWFNPILWFAFARMRADREAACDASVLSLGATDRRAAYGGALLKLQGAFPSKGLSLGFVGIFEDGSGLKSRIREISKHRPSTLAGRVGGAGIIALLVLFGATRAQQPAGKEVVADSSIDSGRATIEAKLDAIMIPKLDVKNAELEEVVGFLRLRSVELDTEKVTAQKGINFVIRRPRPGEKNPFKAGTITLQKMNTSLRELVVEISKQAGMNFKTDDFALTFFPPGSGVEPGNPAPMSKPPTGKAMTAGSKIIIPRIDFVDTNLAEAVDFLNLRARELTKEGPVYPIILDPSADPKARIRELRLRNVPLPIAIKYCTDQTKHTWIANDKEFRISNPAKKVAVPDEP